MLVKSGNSRFKYKKWNKTLILSAAINKSTKLKNTIPLETNISLNTNPSEANDINLPKYHPQKKCCR